MFCADYIAAFIFHASLVALINRSAPSVASGALGVSESKTSKVTLPFLFGGAAGFCGASEFMGHFTFGHIRM